MDEDIEYKSIIEASLNELINDLKNKLPLEPNENSSSVTITYSYQSNTFQRRFNNTDKIQVRYYN